MKFNKKLTNLKYFLIGNMAIYLQQKYFYIKFNILQDNNENLIILSQENENENETIINWNKYDGV